MDFAHELAKLMELKGYTMYRLAKEIALSGDDLRESYQSFTRQERRAVWKSVIDRIDVDGDSLTVTFRA